MIYLWNLIILYAVHFGPRNSAKQLYDLKLLYEQETRNDIFMAP